MLTATTYIRPYKVAAGKGAVQTMEERFDYGLNPKKLGALSSYLCDPATAPAEFLLVKSQYQAETGRAVERGALFFQIRQAFPPGEVTAEEANPVSYTHLIRCPARKNSRSRPSPEAAFSPPGSGDGVFLSSFVQRDCW